MCNPGLSLILEPQDHSAGTIPSPGYCSLRGENGHLVLSPVPGVKLAAVKVVAMAANAVCIITPNTLPDGLPRNPVPGAWPVWS